MGYTIEQYLLDKSNIHDTVTQLLTSSHIQMHAFDSRSVSDLVDKVYTPEIFLDYDPLMGGRPRTTTSKEWAEKVKDIHSPNILIKISNPETSDSTLIPENCVVEAYAHGLFYNKDDQGFPRVMAMRNGGDYTLELVRMAGLQEKGQNPWRIQKHKSRLAWQDRPVQEHVK
ncbi:hypothetical protein FGLOB1_1665 [Fusarium globosum]|uniref:Uncharacterized protein n=1 Tax=Fusarium globosum TaxID=78864 RepID=A0A8H6DIZ5_9HYPO|nr:hypothetical protein FGLOB1_1665 [Fusarium globosum]